MSAHAGPKAVTNGLVLELDAGNTKSYPGTGTTWFDLSGNGYHGTLVSSPSFAASNGGAFTFNGSSNYATLPYAGLLNLGNAFTIQATIKLPDITNITDYTVVSALDVTNPVVTKGYSFGWQRDLSYALPAKGLRLQLGKSIWAWNLQGSAQNSIADTNWHNVAVVCSALTTTPIVVFYVDGVASTTSQWSASPNAAINYATTTASVRVAGTYPATLPSYQTTYSAHVSADLRIYNRALSADEILQNFQAHRGRFGI